MFGGVVEKLVAIREGVGLGDDMQEIELRHAQTGGQFDDFVNDAHVLFVDDHIDVDDGPVGISNGAYHPFDESFKPFGRLGQAIVQLCIVAVKRKGDFSQTGPHGIQIELSVGESIPIGDRLYPVIPDVFGVPNEVEELGMQTGFTTTDDDFFCIQLLAASQQLGADLFFFEVYIPRRVGIEAE